MIRPTVFGYVQVPRTAHGFPRRPATDRRDLIAFTEREGFALDRIFVDVHRTADQAALHALIAATSTTHVVAIIVPDWSHLGGTTTIQDLTYTLISETVGVPVLAAKLGARWQHP